MTYEQLHAILKSEGFDMGFEKVRTGIYFHSPMETESLWLTDSPVLFPLVEERLNDIKKEFNLPIKIESFPNEEVIKIKLV